MKIRLLASAFNEITISKRSARPYLRYILLSVTYNPPRILISFSPLSFFLLSFSNVDEAIHPFLWHRRRSRFIFIHRILARP